jgi:hypothetical protein
MAQVTTNFAGDVYLNPPANNAIIHASGDGLLAASVKFTSIQHGTAGYIAMYDGTTGVLSEGQYVSTAQGGFGLNITSSPATVFAAGDTMVALSSLNAFKRISGSTTGVANNFMVWDGAGTLNGVTFNVGGDIVTAGDITTTAGDMTATAGNITTTLGNVYGVNIVASSHVTTTAPLADTDATTKKYVDDLFGSLSGGFFWLDPILQFYDPTGGLPVGGSLVPPDRYIATATANGWTINVLYELTSMGPDVWTATPPVLINGMATTITVGPSAPASFVYTVTAGWVPIGFNGKHDNLVQKEYTNSSSGVPVSFTAPYANSLVFGWSTMTDRVWRGRAEVEGVSQLGAGVATCEWNLTVVNNAGVATIYVSSEHSTVQGDLATVVPTITARAVPPLNYVDIRVSDPQVVAVKAQWHGLVEGSYASIPL